MNKKGFTLIELLAVISILALLVLLFTPEVLKLFNSTSEKQFRNNAASVLDAVQNEYLVDAIDGGVSYRYYCSEGPSTPSHSSTTLSSNTGLKYSVSLDTNDNITCVVIQDNTYRLELTGTNITKSSLENVVLKGDDAVTPAATFTCACGN